MGATLGLVVAASAAASERLLPDFARVDAGADSSAFPSGAPFAASSEAGLDCADRLEAAPDRLRLPVAREPPWSRYWEKDELASDPTESVVPVKRGLGPPPAPAKRAPISVAGAESEPAIEFASIG